MSEHPDFVPPATVRRSGLAALAEPPGSPASPPPGRPAGRPGRRPRPAPAGRDTGSPARDMPGWCPTGFLRGAKRSARSVLRAITPLGWTMLTLGAVSWVLAALYGWTEAGVVAVAALALVPFGALFTVGRLRAAITLTVQPRRVGVGRPAVAAYEVRHTATRRGASLRVRLPVGEAVARFTVPPLAPGETHDDQVIIPTTRRGVVPVGPVITYRDDPLGLVRREVAWTTVLELLIHPAIQPLDSVGTGLLRDLEGRPTPDVSVADFAFHSLREYVPGDDRRFIDQKSSARLSAVAGEDRFMVRQFFDTRQTHLAIVSDAQESHFTATDEFELALSCAASVAARAVADDMAVTVFCADEVCPRPAAGLVLDPYARAQWGARPLAREFQRVVDRAPDASLVVLVTGARTEFADLQRGRATLPSNVNLLVIRVATGAPVALRTAGTVVELTVGTLVDLPRALRGGVR